MRCQTADRGAEMTEDSVMEVEVGMVLAMMEVGDVRLIEREVDGVKENEKKKVEI